MQISAFSTKSQIHSQSKRKQRKLVRTYSLMSRIFLAQALHHKPWISTAAHRGINSFHLPYASSRSTTLVITL